MAVVKTGRDAALILIADDETLMRMTADEALSEEGFRVEVVENGRDAVEAYRRLRPDIVILDVNMPEMDGFAACHEIRRSPGGDRTPVLLMTGLDDLDSIKRAYEVGATDFQTKPVNWIILTQRLRYMLRARDNFEAMLKSEAKTRALLRAIPDSMIRISRDGKFLDYKPAKGFDPLMPPGAFLGRRLTDVLPTPVSDECLQSIRRALKQGQPQVFEYPAPVDGSARAYEIRAVTSGEDEALAIVRDITDQKQSAQTLQRERDFIAKVLETARALVMVRDRQGRIVRFNRACEEATQYSSEEVEGRRVWDFLLLPDEVSVEKSAFLNVIAGRCSDGYQTHWLTRMGGRRLIAWSNSILTDKAGRVEHVISTGIDITERQQAEEQVQYLAYYDSLTGLPNRVQFKEQLNRALVEAQPTDRSMALLFLDIDRFKQINDTLGHTLGDLLLKGVAERLQDKVRIDDCVARQSSGEAEMSIGRFGGDEFTILVMDVRDAEAAERIAQRIQKALSEPFELDGQEIYATASIGVSLHPSDGSSAETLLKHADTAMYAAKNQGRNSYRMYSSSMASRSFTKFSLENDLRKALTRDEMALYYQPKLEVRTGRVIGAEALIRWLHPSKGLILPSDFIPLAEETGLILPIGNWGLQAVCHQNLTWQKAGFTPVPVAVNLSSIQFQQKDLLEMISEILVRVGVDPWFIEVELTESTIMQNLEEAGRTLWALKSMGIQLSVDDFGTGYSSLSYLKRFTIDTLKIDRSFVKDLTSNADDRAITTAIIAMAHNLGLKVIAEGVETEHHLDFLRDHGCDEAQGYLFSPPVPADDFAEKYLSKQPAGLSVLPLWTYTKPTGGKVAV